MQTAYITGAASGLGKATAKMLVEKGIKVFIADLDIVAARSVCDELNELVSDSSFHLQCAVVDISDWNSQAKAFTQAVSALDGRIDHVYAVAGVGEQRWLPMDNLSDGGYEMPDLGTLDVDLKGTLYTVALAIQQFRRQGPGSNGRNGQTLRKYQDDNQFLAFYHYIKSRQSLMQWTQRFERFHSFVRKVPHLRKHLVERFVSTFSHCLTAHSSIPAGVCPNVVRTNISTSTFYDEVEQRGLLTPLNAVPDTFAALLDGELKDSSGELYELGPNYGKNGEKWIHKLETDLLDTRTREILDLLEERARPLQIPR